MSRENSPKHSSFCPQGAGRLVPHATDNVTRPTEPAKRAPLCGSARKKSITKAAIASCSRRERRISRSPGEAPSTGPTKEARRRQNGGNRGPPANGVCPKALLRHSTRRVGGSLQAKGLGDGLLISMKDRRQARTRRCHSRQNRPAVYLTVRRAIISFARGGRGFSRSPGRR